VSQLAGMMRLRLQGSQVDTVRLADELAAVAVYLAMEKLRFEERLNLSLDIAPGLDDVAVPPMALQTLVENAVKYGVELSAGVCRIRIAAQRHDCQVLVSVANEGRLNEASASTRLGLHNTSKRLALLFGPQSTCSLAESNGWVTASIVLPQGQP
jgi:LytS/YehU family sensor histidine kinase